MLLVGCGAAPGTTSSGSGAGADGGVWPTRTNTNTTDSTHGAASDAPQGRLVVVLHGTAAPDIELAVNIATVELGYEDHNWASVAKSDTVAKFQAMPFRFDKNSQTALLSDTKIQRRKYTSLRLTLAEKKTSYTEKAGVSLPMTTADITLPLDAWTLTANGINYLTITVDGTKVTKAKDKAQLPANAFTVSKTAPIGGISGTVAPANVNATLSLFWGASATPFATAVADIKDGRFSFANLPAGQYRLQLTAAGYHLDEHALKPITVDTKVLSLDPLTLTKDQ